MLGLTGKVCLEVNGALTPLGTVMSKVGKVHPDIMVAAGQTSGKATQGEYSTWSTHSPFSGLISDCLDN